MVAAAEFVFAECPIAQGHPKKLLAFGGLAPQVAGMLR